MEKGSQTSRQRAQLLHEAKFDERLKTYVLLSAAIVMLATVVGIILIPFWLILGRIYVNRYFENLECKLTTRSLHFKKGLWFTTEKTIPLDKIQDLTFKEGPILRYLGLSRIMIETAGNAAQGVTDMSLIGIISAREFREMVLDQRDEITDKDSRALAAAGSSSSFPQSNAPDEMVSLLREMNETLKRIESKT
ncbi:hypothetical protein DDZ15_07465 [Rhodohalobacter mucosus]|uniref:YdbS-like PH domain-containing protein n=2 Tax=Rhodohalobacter mucosus TaxID=2079485 RepID=A0A316TX60_9BACT|nr:hypothetical protein DDZ15_07465 [Rhodohalobacter mucosus]